MSGMLIIQASQVRAFEAYAVQPHFQPWVRLCCTWLRRRRRAIRKHAALPRLGRVLARSSSRSMEISDDSTCARKVCSNREQGSAPKAANNQFYDSVPVPTGTVNAGCTAPRTPMCSDVLCTQHRLVLQVIAHPKRGSGSVNGVHNRYLLAVHTVSIAAIDIRIDVTLLPSRFVPSLSHFLSWDSYCVACHVKYRAS